jgi:hypothetical protein
MRLKILSILYISFVSFSCHAQEISIGYLGNNLWNPGINLSIDQKIKNLHHTLDFAIYCDPGSYTAALALYGLKKLKSKWSFAAYPVGIYRSFLPNTYRVDASNQISEPSSLAGNFYFCPTISIQRKHYKRFYSKAQVLVLMPYNTFVMPVINLGIGYIINPSKEEKPFIQL